MAELIDEMKANGASSGLIVAPLGSGAGAPKPDIADQLTKLADLRDRGVLTEAEFDAHKTKLLAEN